jgi:hypothetical protein
LLLPGLIILLEVYPYAGIDLWDSDPYLACCTTPTGYHPSVYGDYLNALVLFGQITGVNPETLLSEFDPTNIGSAAYAIGVSASIAQELAIAAEDTILAGNVTTTPLPGTWSMMIFGLAGIAFLSYRQSRSSQTSSRTIMLANVA